jgi:hypothetical protein
VNPDALADDLSINPRLRLDVFDVVGEREIVHRAIVDLHLAALSAPAVEPGDVCFIQFLSSRSG